MSAVTPPTPQEIATAVENVGKLARWWKYLKGLFGRGSKAAVPMALLVASIGCSSHQIEAGAAVVGAAVPVVIKVLGSGPLPEPPGTETPRPTPTPAPTETPAVPHGNACDPTDRSDCDCLKYVVPNWIYHACPTETPAPTPTPSPAPTTAPTQAPTAAPTIPPAPDVACLNLASVPRQAVRAVQAGPCRPGFRRLDYAGGHVCLANWSCADGDDSKNCPNKLDPDINAFHNLTPDPTDGMIHDGEHPRTDAYCRNLYDNDAIMQPGAEPDGYVPQAWERAGVCRPVICATATPPPAGTPGPTPVPPSVGQPADFRASLVAACQELHYTEAVDGGLWKGKCDSTIRYAGTLKSGEFIRSTCDWDHQHCAVDSCADQTPDQIAQHRKVYELCGGNEWFTPDGTVFHVQGAQRVEVDRKNNYQVWIWGHEGDDIRLYACLPTGARRDDGVSIPMDGQACGGEHPVTFEAPR